MSGVSSASPASSSPFRGESQLDTPDPPRDQHFRGRDVRSAPQPAPDVRRRGGAGLRDALGVRTSDRAHAEDVRLERKPAPGGADDLAVRRSPRAPAGSVTRSDRVPHTRALRVAVDDRCRRRRGRARGRRLPAHPHHGALRTVDVERRPGCVDHLDVARAARGVRGRGEPGDDGVRRHRRDRPLPPRRAPTGQPRRLRRVTGRDRRHHARGRGDRNARLAPPGPVPRPRDRGLLDRCRTDGVQGVHRATTHLSGHPHPALGDRARRYTTHRLHRRKAPSSRRRHRARSSHSPRRTLVAGRTGRAIFPNGNLQVPRPRLFGVDFTPQTNSRCCSRSRSRCSGSG